MRNMTNQGESIQCIKGTTSSVP